ncbi:MAG TPA: carbohydrate ABC transporter permease [Caldilineae bacterium]|jgi:ABC-type glycerol-3-phosphate transport system permease component|nr:carbohydrate ABC transporter permease [Caldilineae bacterium]
MQLRLKIGYTAATRIQHTIIYIFLTGASVIFLFPLFWMVSTSLKTVEEISAYPIVWWPKKLQWVNYPSALRLRPFDIYLKNTMIIVTLSALGDVIACSFVAYGFARLRFPGRDALFVLLLSTMMLPGIVRLIPLFVLFQRMGWIDTFLPLIVPNWFGTPFFIFLLRQYFMTIPEDLADAARIDGASEFGIWWRIMLPLSGPVLAVILIFSFQANWNDFLGPLIYLNSTAKKTLALGLYEMRNLPYEEQNFHLMMAASTLMVLPVITIFALFQRYFIQGVTLTGIKG